MTVLVTGASGGIGAAIAERFASVGMNVVLHYMKSHEATNEAARRCMERGNGRIMTVSADLRSREQIQRMREKLVRSRVVAGYSCEQRWYISLWFASGCDRGNMG